MNNSIKLLILYGFFVLKKNYFFTFTAHEYDVLIVDGHNIIFLPINLGSETHDFVFLVLQLGLWLPFI